MPHRCEGEELHLHGLPAALKYAGRNNAVGESNFTTGLRQKGSKQVTLERFVSEEFSKPHVTGFAPAGDIHPAPPAFGRSTFLLAPGGQDYVGENSYDEVSQMDK